MEFIHRKYEKTPILDIERKSLKIYFFPTPLEVKLCISGQKTLGHWKEDIKPLNMVFNHSCSTQWYSLKARQCKAMILTLDFVSICAKGLTRLNLRYPELRTVSPGIEPVGPLIDMYH